MNLILFEAEELQGSSLVLTGRRAIHIRKVLRAKTGDTLRVGMLNGNTGTGNVYSIDKKKVELEVSLPLMQPAKSGIHLILALPRPIMLKRILKQGTALGVETFHLIRSKRVEKSFFQSNVLEPEKIKVLLLQGLEQAMATRLPKVNIHYHFRPFAEDFIPELPQENRLLAHPGSENSLASVLKKQDFYQKQTVLAIGPEGGWNDFEVSMFRDQNFHVFSMGTKILPVDTAVVSLLAQLQFYRDFCSL